MNLVDLQRDMEINICPQWLLRKSGLPAEVHQHAAMLLSNLSVLLLAPLLIAIPHVCLFHLLLGIPCPGCGILHGMAALLRLDFASAYRSNPAALILSSLLAFQIAARPVAIKLASARPLVNTISQRLSVVVYGSLLCVWFIRLICGGIHGVRLMP